MVVIQSQRNISLLLQGHRFQSFAEEEEPVSFDAPEMLSVKYGDDGTMYVKSSGMLGGEMTVRLAPTSRSAGWCLTRRMEVKRGTPMVLAGTYSDPNRNYSADLRGGVLVSCPTAVTPGTTFEATFKFEEIDAHSEGALFGDPPGRT